MSKKIAALTNEEVETINSLKSMVESCYTYGGADKDSLNYKKYIEPYKEKLHPLLFITTYHNELQRLQAYEVVNNVYTDNEGCTYNSLTLKQTKQ